MPTLATLPTLSGELAHIVYFPMLLAHALETWLMEGKQKAKTV